ncbi:hypothetical protein [Parasediminibacterium sp. JCM 36343]|uniref:hypothetical protein n=1 Tax=Parasediminibacterium sp. JCM 36343 TaxID=3374279 RepID=UPI00397CA03F
MKNNLNSFLSGKCTIALALFILTIASCKKDTATPGAATPAVTQFAAIATASNFNWNSTNKIAFNFTGLQGQSFNSILKITASDGSVVLQKLQKGDENFSTTFNVPSNYPTINVQFGSVTKTFITRNGSVNMNLN